MLSFSKKYLNSYHTLEQSMIGFEFEAFTDHSYIKLMEIINLRFQPLGKEVWGFNKYHSEMTPTADKWKIEPDYSGGSDMFELITGPMTWSEAKLALPAVLRFIQDECRTDDYCSVHINISFKNENIQHLNPVKLILNFSEDYVYSKFPNRRNNIYAQSIKWIIPFTDWENSETALSSIVNCMQIPDDTKYYGINLQKKWKGWLEYRYIGGKDYQFRIDDILDLCDYFVLQSWNAITSPLNDEDNIKLLSYLDEGIGWYKQWQTYDLFLSNRDDIKIEIDQSSDYDTVRNSWHRFWTKLFVIVRQCDLIEGGIINLNTTTNRLELVDMTMSGVHNMQGVDLINCKVKDATLNSVVLVNTFLENGHIYNSKLYKSDIRNCKVSNSKVLDWTKLERCAFEGGEMDGQMTGGVFRSGKLGPNSEVDNTVKMANKDSFWQVWSPEDKMIKKWK